MACPAFARLASTAMALALATPAARARLASGLLRRGVPSAALDGVQIGVATAAMPA
jgi:hypothetical protein